jgi:integrase
MAITKRHWLTKDGKSEAWVVRYYDAEGKYRTKTFDTKRAAEAWEAEMRVDKKKGIHRPDSTSITVRQAGALWLETCKAENLEPEAIRSYELHLRLHIYPAIAPKNAPAGWDGQLGDLKLSKLNTPMCEVFKRLVSGTKARTNTLKVTDRTISRKTAGHILASFKTMLNDAQRCGLISYNPALPVRIKIRERDRAPLRIGEHIPDRVDVAAIVNASIDMWRVLFKTDASTGMRSSELRSLSWPNINLVVGNGKITVCNRADRRRKIGSVKTPASYRTIQIGDDLVAELRGWKEISPPSALKLVFPDEKGNVMSEGTIRRALYEVQLRIGLTKPGRGGEPRPKYHVHRLRHFYASIMIDVGTPPKRLQELLGHSTLQMTMDLYGHLFPPTSDEIDRINRAMSKVFVDAAE